MWPGWPGARDIRRSPRRRVSGPTGALGFPWMPRSLPFVSRLSSGGASRPDHVAAGFAQLIEDRSS